MVKPVAVAIVPSSFGDLTSFNKFDDDDDAVDNVDFGLFLNGLVNPENLPAF